MKRGWIIELEPGVYKADFSGRTLVIDNARRYKTISAATHGLAMMRYFSHFLNAKIYHDDHIEAEPAQDDGKPGAGDDLEVVAQVIRYHISAGGEYEYRGKIAMESFERIKRRLEEAKK